MAKTIQSIQRALKIIEEVTNNTRGITISELSKSVDLNINTTSSIVKTLVITGYLKQFERGGKYYIGNELVRLSAKALNTLELRQKAHPIMTKLNIITRETTHLGILSDGFATDIDVLKNSNTVGLNIPIGNKLRLHCSGLGKVLLAWKDFEEINFILDGYSFEKFTPNTIDTFEEFWKELQQVRAQGYAFNREESEKGVCCVSAPVFNFYGYVIAGMSVSSPKERFQEKRIPILIDLVTDATKKISKEMGYFKEMNYCIYKKEENY